MSDFSQVVHLWTSCWLVGPLTLSYPSSFSRSIGIPTALFYFVLSWNLKIVTARALGFFDAAIFMVFMEYVPNVKPPPRWLGIGNESCRTLGGRRSWWRQDIWFLFKQLFKAKIDLIFKKNPRRFHTWNPLLCSDETSRPEALIAGFCSQCC